MKRRTHRSITGAFATAAAGALLVALPMSPDQADDQLVNLQIQ